MRYVIFGDSFGDAHGQRKLAGSNTDAIWHENLDAPVMNLAKSGTSVHQSIDALFDYIDSDEYKDSDRLIFIISNFSRAIRYTDGKYKQHAVSIIDEAYKKPQTDWEKYHNENLNAHHYIALNVLTRKFHINTLRLLHNYLENLPNETLLLHAFNTDDREDELKDYSKFLKSISYNKGLVFDNNEIDWKKSFSLMRVSIREFDSQESFQQAMSKHGDLRPNHLSYENHDVLSKLVKQYFETKNYDIFKLESFKDNIMTEQKMIDEHKRYNNE